MGASYVQGVQEQMNKMELYNSWKSAIGGLILLGGQIKQSNNWKLFIVPVAKEDKKKIKTAVRFLKYIIKRG